MPSLDLPGLRTFFTDDGAGDPTVLLVHGWACDSHDWDAQIDVFARHHRVVAADNRGHGRSSVPDDGYTPRRFAADLATLVERLGCGPVVAVGHSLGGVIVSALRSSTPDLVRAVVAVDPAYGVADQAARYLFEVLAGLRSEDPDATVAAVFTGMDTDATPVSLRAMHRRRALGTPIRVVVDTLAGIYEPPDQIGLRDESSVYLAPRTCPVLTIHAHQEPADWDATTLRHPQSRAVAWEGAGHWLHQERPDEFNRLVLEWIASLG